MDAALTSAEKRQYNRELLRFTFPAIFEQFLIRVSAIAGSAFLGHVGAAELSASSLSSTLMTMLEALLMGVSLGITVVCARFFSDKEKVKRAATAGLVMEIILSLVLLFAMHFASDGIISLLFSSAEEKVRLYTANYFSICVYACPFMAIDFTCSALMRSSGDSRTPFIITLSSNCLNLTGIYLCLNVLHYDYRSVAVCYCISLGVNAFAKFAVVLSGKHKTATLRFRKFDFSYIKLIAKIGVPSMTERFLIQFAFLGIQTVTTLLGTAVLAGYQAANNVINFTYTITGGFEIALVSMVGRYKYENKSAARQMVKASYLYACVFTFALGAVFFIFADRFVTIFAGDKEVIAEAVNILRLLVLTIPLTTGFQAGIGALKTGSDINYSLAATVIAPNFIRVPIAYFLVSSMGMGFMGLYLGCVCDYAIRAAVVIWRILRQRWVEE